MREPLRYSAPVSFAALLSAFAEAQAPPASWLNSPAFESWNTPAMSIPTAPQGQKNPDPRCRELTRSPSSDADSQLLAHGWDLVGPPSEAGQIRAMAGAADYDGMCRPRQYQYFVFARSIFAGTLSPHLMDSRTDGALVRVTIESDRKLQAEFVRYKAAADPLCCPSGRTTVVFGIEGDPPVVRALSARSISDPNPSSSW
jgi:hypothetical protein